MTNSNYKIKDKDGKKGLIRIIDNVLIIPFMYEKIEFIGLQFLRAELGNKVFIINLSNEIVLEMIIDITGEKWNSIFSHENKAYKMFATEECDDYFSIYFRLLNNKNNKIKKSILLVIFQENQLHYRLIKECKLPPFF